jgi:hypothetical protein
VNVSVCALAEDKKKPPCWNQQEAFWKSGLVMEILKMNFLKYEYFKFNSNENHFFEK